VRDESQERNRGLAVKGRQEKRGKTSNGKRKKRVRKSPDFFIFYKCKRSDIEG